MKILRNIMSVAAIFGGTLFCNTIEEVVLKDLADKQKYLKNLSTDLLKTYDNFFQAVSESEESSEQSVENVHDDIVKILGERRPLPAAPSKDLPMLPSMEIVRLLIDRKSNWNERVEKILSTMSHSQRDTYEQLYEQVKRVDEAFEKLTPGSSSGYIDTILKDIKAVSKEVYSALEKEYQEFIERKPIALWKNDVSTYLQRLSMKSFILKPGMTISDKDAQSPDNWVPSPSGKPYKTILESSFYKRSLPKDAYNQYTYLYQQKKAAIIDQWFKKRKDLKEFAQGDFGSQEEWENDTQSFVQTLIFNDFISQNLAEKDANKWYLVKDTQNSVDNFIAAAQKNNFSENAIKYFKDSINNKKKEIIDDFFAKEKFKD